MGHTRKFNHPTFWGGHLATVANTTPMAAGGRELLELVDDVSELGCVATKN